jgi:Sec-independent protein translocase protein TatA
MSPLSFSALLSCGEKETLRPTGTTGRWIGRAQRVARELRTEFDRDVGREELTRLQQDLRSTTTERIVLPEPTATPPAIQTAVEPKGPGAA